MAFADAVLLLTEHVGEPEGLGKVVRGPSGRELFWDGGEVAVLLFDSGAAYVTVGDEVVARAGWTTRAGVVWLARHLRNLRR